MRKIKAEEIQVRVSTVTAKGCSLLLYKDARFDRAILDEEYGKMNWQNDFKVIDGKMYGYISVYDKEKKEWVTKSDCGVESNTEAEKGQASDCFKRAGFKWGIGIELYTAPFIFVQCGTIKDGSKYVLENKYTKYKVSEIGYSDIGEINKLIITDDKGNIVFEMGKYIKPVEKNKESDKKQEVKKKEVSDKDLEFYEVVAATDNIDDLKGYYNQTKELVTDRKAYHTLVCDRIKKLKT